MLPLLPTVEPGFTTRSELDIPPPLYTMEPASLDGTFNELRLHSNGTDASTPPQSAPPRNADEANGHEVGLLKPHEWSWATLVRNTRITEKDWWQDVREIELEFEDTEAGKYLPGSICSLQPRMSAQEVNDFLHLNGLAEEADTVFYLRPANPGTFFLLVPHLTVDQPLPPHLPTGHTPTSLRSLLTNHLDLRGSPRRSFFEWMRRFVVDERESERLDEFLSDPDEVFNYATRPSRTVVESLGDFREMKLPKEYLCEILPSLRRRQFSMANSSEVCGFLLLLATVLY
jgi:sulfite reductase alpha subunit-like flavoprotein